MNEVIVYPERIRIGATKDEFERGDSIINTWKMNLNKDILSELDNAKISVPDESVFALPEKVLQFGTGVLLRGLPDYFIDRANKHGIFNGRVVVVKSTAAGDSDAFDKQDGMFTLCVKGVEQGRLVEEYILNASISRVLSARSDWDKVLECASNPDLEIIISNTTEVGITLQADDNIRSNPPESFPGKLLAFLFERYKAFNGAKDKGLVIIPTELIPGNGTKLEGIVEELAHLNNFDFSFIEWLESSNHFCNSLVDRIVPGKLAAPKQQQVEKQLGYKDDLMIMSEVYRLWAIEGDETIAAKLSFAKADDGVIIEPNIDKYRELKLRLLNGSHTLSCGLAFLAGFHTVKDAMQHEGFSAYITRLMYEEIIPAITGEMISDKEAKEFAASVLDRFRNPHIDHQWLSITAQYSSKIRMRVVPIMERYFEKFGAVPQQTALGLAAYILFMKTKKDATGKYWGSHKDRNYLVSDDLAEFCHVAWQSANNEMVQAVLKNEDHWGVDLSRLPGLAKAVEDHLGKLQNNGAASVLEKQAPAAVAV